MIVSRTTPWAAREQAAPRLARAEAADSVQLAAEQRRHVERRRSGQTARLRGNTRGWSAREPRARTASAPTKTTPPGRSLAWAWRALGWQACSKRRGDELVRRPRDGPQRPERVQVRGKWSTKSHDQRASPRRRRALFGRLALGGGWETSATTGSTRVFSAVSMAVRGSPKHLESDESVNIVKRKGASELCARIGSGRTCWSWSLPAGRRTTQQRQ